MARKLRAGEDHTGEVWSPYDRYPSQEAFLIVGPPTKSWLAHLPHKYELVHPVLHLATGRTSTRREISRPWWIRTYVQVQ